MQKAGIDLAFPDADQFPGHKIGPNDSITLGVSSLKEVVAWEAAQLIEQQKRLSVRDLAKKFETGLRDANLSNEAKWKEISGLDRHVLLGKLSDVLESLRDRVAGRNRNDVDDAISMVEALAVQLTQREGEILHEKAEVKRLAIIMKQASEDAKRVVEDERALARAEVECAKETVDRVEKALKEQEYIPSGVEQEKLEELMKEVREARRIKMLHRPSKVRDMEHELQGLRLQLEDKSSKCVQLKKELELNKRLQENQFNLYKLEGSEILGSCLRIVFQTDNDVILDYSIQWYRTMPDKSKRKLISGARNTTYAPDPFDVGHILLADFILDNGEKFTVATDGPVNPAPGLISYVDTLARKKETEFNVVVLQMNENVHTSLPVHVLRVGKSRIKLQKGRTTKAREIYSTSMQIFGARSGGYDSAKSLFWKITEGLSFTLAFESEIERNAAIMLAHKFAFDCDVMLSGPDDRAFYRT